MYLGMHTATIKNRGAPVNIPSLLLSCELGPKLKTRFGPSVYLSPGNAGASDIGHFVADAYLPQHDSLNLATSCV